MVGIRWIFQWVVKNALKSAENPTEMQLKLLFLYAMKTENKLSEKEETTLCMPKLPRLPVFSPCFATRWTSPDQFHSYVVDL